MRLMVVASLFVAGLVSGMLFAGVYLTLMNSNGLNPIARKLYQCQLNLHEVTSVAVEVSRQSEHLFHRMVLLESDPAYAHKVQCGSNPAAGVGGE